MREIDVLSEIGRGRRCAAAVKLKGVAQVDQQRRVDREDAALWDRDVESGDAGVCGNEAVGTGRAEQVEAPALVHIERGAVFRTLSMVDKYFEGKIPFGEMDEKVALSISLNVSATTNNYKERDFSDRKSVV